MADANTIIGIAIIVINLIPMLLRKWNYLPFTITLSVLLALILNLV